MTHIRTITKSPQKATNDLDRFVNILTFVIQILTAFNTLFATKDDEDSRKMVS